MYGVMQPGYVVWSLDVLCYLAMLSDHFDVWHTLSIECLGMSWYHACV